ncbi:MAG: hypothetical protein ACKVP7_04840 [Hyphomicrobiaceae bacterium]
MCASIAWAIAFKRLVLIGDSDPFGFTTWQIRAMLVGGGFVACLAVARYLTYRPGRGMGIGLANFVVMTAVLVVFFCSLCYLRQGGEVSDIAALGDYGRRIAAVYGGPVFVTFAAFLSCELLLARL